MEKRGDHMNTRIADSNFINTITAIFFSTLLIVLSMGGCASTINRPAPGPSTPDQMQLQHYESLVSAIDAKNRVDALAALALFEADIFRWQEDTLTLANAITEILALTDAVDKEEWASAKQMVEDLVSKYRCKE
jgi:hypothetical protein